MEDNNEDGLNSKSGMGEEKKTSWVYPRYGMGSSLEVAKIAHNKAGGKCNSEQLAALLGYNGVNNGAFLSRVAAAKMFGFIKYDRGKKVHEVTERAKIILAPVREGETKKKKVEIFKTIPLFNSLLTELKGATLPSEEGLKNLLIHSFGFNNAKAGRALKVFLDSAQFSGFFEIDNNRLIEPVISDVEPENGGDSGSGSQESERVGNGNPSPPTHSPSENPPNIHVAIMGLLNELPPVGSTWDSAHKERFMAAFKTTIDFIYPDQ